MNFENKITKKTQPKSIQFFGKFFLKTCKNETKKEKKVLKCLLILKRK